MSGSKVTWMCGVLLAPLLLACSSPSDPLGLADRRALAPGSRDAPGGAASGAAPEGDDEGAAVPVAGPEVDTGRDTSVGGPVDGGAAEAAAPAAPVVETAVTDLAYEVVTNGYGPVGKDMSNGELAASDGAPLTIGGVTYAKGLGVHSPSEVKVPLGGAFKTFLVDVGVDDEVAEKGTVTFRVLADGVLLFDSGILTGAAGATKVSVSVAGKQQLVLVVTDAGDGGAYDHADWAGARLVR